MAKHSWAAKQATNGAWWVGCSGCGALDKGFRTQEKAKERVRELINSQKRPDFLPKTSLVRRQREAKKVKRWIDAFTGGALRRQTAQLSEASANIAEPNESSQQ